MRIRVGIIFVLLLLFLTVIAQNTEEITIQAFFWAISSPRFVLLGITLLVGVLIGILLGRPWRRTKKVAAKPKTGKTPTSASAKDRDD
jgi:uncharacterized integral membrane protein